LAGLQEAISRMMNADGRRNWGTTGRERLEREFCWVDKLRIAREALTEWR
jgi:hypothetical protein